MQCTRAPTYRAALHTRDFETWPGSLIPEYGGCRRGIHTSRDQLERADAGNSQIADGSATRTARPRGTSVSDFRVRFVVEPQLIPQLCASPDGRRHGGAVPRRSRTTRSWYPRCGAAAPGHVVNMLTDEQQYSRHADAAAVLLCGRATPL